MGQGKTGGVMAYFWREIEMSDKERLSTESVPFFLWYSFLF